MPLLTFPNFKICSEIFIAKFVGIASPIPMLPGFRPPEPIIAVFIPINSPRRLTSAPPEFPGFIDASV
ncbi:MAG: hypothetical protein CM15mP93_06020 [Thiotrichaceae bacterium]|nr:MAG: hypothetical protein CM15mP93_06020 [Thiotrichaceae bacterium]